MIYLVSLPSHLAPAAVVMDPKKEQKSSLAPQLARPCYNLDSSSGDEEDYNNSDDDDGSLQILPPTTRKRASISPPIKPKKGKSGKTVAEAIDLSSTPTRPPKQYASSKPTSNNDSLTSIAVKAKSAPKGEFETAKVLSTAASNISTASRSNKKEVSAKPTAKKFNSFVTANDFSSSDEENDDDDDIFNAKPTFETQCQMKEREKQAKTRKRQEKKKARLAQKEHEKEAKKRDHVAFAQSNGKYKHDEVAVLMDPQLYTGDPLGLISKLSVDFLVHSYPSKLSMAPAAIQFVRKDYLRGGAKDAVECLVNGNMDGYEHIHDLVLVVDPHDFIRMLQRQDKTEDDDYPLLEQWLDSIKRKWQQLWKVSSHMEPRLLLLLRNVPETLDKMWVQHRRHRNSSTDTSLPTAWELSDATQWLLIQFQVECMHCPNEDFIQLTLQKMTRSISEKPYTTQVSELECVRKIKPGPAVLSNDPVDQARDVWLRQLQSIPGVSETMALNVVEKYPTCQSLWQAYQQLHQQENRSPALLLADVLTGRDYRQKLSQVVFQIMTSNSPEEMIL